jgi:outer membrane protein TolC
LNALLNLPEDTLLPWPDENLEAVVLEDEYRDTKALFDSLKKGNPRLKALSEHVAIQQETLKLSQREYFPDLTVGITSVDTGDALNRTTIDSGRDPLMIMFSVNVPIWFGRLQAGVQDARASLKAAQNTVLNAENELLSQLTLVHYKVRDSLRQSHLYRDALIPKALQAVNATYSGYEAGEVNFLSLIDAQRVLLNFQLAFYRHNANFYQRLSELQSLLGEVEIDTKEEL